MGFVTVIYLLISAAFLAVLPIEQITSNTAFVAQFGEVLFGTAGAKVLSLCVVVCVLGGLAALSMTTPRVTYAMAHAGAFFRSFGKMHPRFGTPANAILLQTGLSLGVLLLGTFDRVLAYIIFSAVLFLALTASTLFRMKVVALSCWFNPGAFAVPTAGQFGNAGRNMLRGPAFAQLDVSLHKDFAIAQEKKLTVGVEAYNLLIVRQGKLAGVLYLENKLAPLVFTSSRVAVLQLLASQAAISLENASLYSDLELQAGLLQNLPVSAWTLKPDGTPDFVNQVWLDYSGQSLDFVRSHPEAWMAAVHPEDRERASSAFWHGVRSGHGFATETRSLRVKDGTYRWHLQQAVPLRDAEGRVLKFVGTTTDIDNQKRAEEKFRKSENDLRKVLDSIPGLVFVMNPTGKLELPNRQLLDYFGKSADELDAWATSLIASRLLTIRFIATCCN